MMIATSKIKSNLFLVNMALVGFLWHSMATGHSGAKSTRGLGHIVTGHAVAGALGHRGTQRQHPNIKCKTKYLENA